MAKENKRVTLHPLNEDGSIDTNINLYPKTFLDGIVDRDGNAVEVAKKSDLDTLATKEEVASGLESKLDTYYAEETFATKEALEEKADKSEIPTNYVTLDTNQDISGDKKFLGDIIFQSNDVHFLDSRITASQDRGPSNYGLEIPSTDEWDSNRTIATNVDIANVETLVDNEQTRAELAESVLESGKVDKVSGKGLSTNDFTNEYKQQVDSDASKLESIESGAQVNVLEGVQVRGTDLAISNKKVNINNVPTTYETDGIGNIANLISSLNGGDIVVENAELYSQDGNRTFVVTKKEEDKCVLTYVAYDEIVDITYTKDEEDYWDYYDEDKLYILDNINRLDNRISTKVDKVSGKELSTNDFTNAYKDKVDENARILEHLGYSSSETYSMQANELSLWNDNNTHYSVGFEDWNLDIYRDKLVGHYEGLATTLLLPLEEYADEDVTKTLATQEWTMQELNSHSNLVLIEYKDLVALRNNNQLIPGQQYRIIDYETTTIQPRTQSAKHKFDIIVVADDFNKLNESARACPHYSALYDVTFGDGVTRKCFTYFPNNYDEDPWCNIVDMETLKGVDGVAAGECELIDREHKVILTLAYDSTELRHDNIRYDYFEANDYFANSKLEAWEVKYCLDNDFDRFAWADDGTQAQEITNIASVFSNGRPLTRQPLFDNRAGGMYADYKYAWGTVTDVEDGDNVNFIYSRNETLVDNEIVANINQNEFQCANVVGGVGKGVIYRLKDEFDNECPYDFKNIQFARYKITSCENCSMLVGKYYAVISNQSYEKLLTDFLDFDDNDYKYFYTFDCYQTDYSLNAIGTTITRPDGSSFTLNQVQCCRCLFKEDEADSTKFYLNNNVVLLESSRDCMIRVNGWSTSNTFLGGAGGLEMFNVFASIVGATSEDFIDGYVGYHSNINLISNSLIISHNYYAIMQSIIDEIGHSCLIGGDRGTIAVSDVGTIANCTLIGENAVIGQSRIGSLYRCNIKCTEIVSMQSEVQEAYELSGSGATHFFYRSLIGFLNQVVMSTDDIARPFINRGNIPYIYIGSFKYINDVSAISLSNCNLDVVSGCTFMHNAYLTCAQALVGCNFGHDVSYLNISSTDTTQTIRNTNFHDICGVDENNIKNVVIPEDYSTIHTVDIYAPGHNTIEIA